MAPRTLNNRYVLPSFLTTSFAIPFSSLFFLYFDPLDFVKVLWELPTGTKVIFDQYFLIFPSSCPGWIWSPMTSCSGFMSKNLFSHLTVNFIIRGSELVTAVLLFFVPSAQYNIRPATKFELSWPSLRLISTPRIKASHLLCQNV